MDSTKLYAIFQAALHQDANVRIAAELELRKLETVQGLVPTLLQLISPAAGNSSAVVRLSASIYLKNRISTSWRIPAAVEPASPAVVDPLIPAATPAAVKRSYAAIPLSDRQSLKTNILPLIAALSSAEVGENGGGAAIKVQMCTVLGKMVDTDFPDDWPTLIDEISRLLQGNEGEVEAGLRGAVEVMRGFRYSRVDPESVALSNVVAHLFPQLLLLGQRISAQYPATAHSLAQQGSLLHLIIKSYKHTLGATLTVSQQADESIIPWITLFLDIIQRTLPEELLPSDLTVRETHPSVKAKKWALYSINRLFTRYGSPSQLPGNMAKVYGPFAEMFMSRFITEIMRSYLSSVERCIRGEWMGGKCKHHLLAFFEECVKPKATWILLKPHVQPLIEQFAFPLLCLMDEEIEAFTEDPVEFSRSHFGDFIEDLYTNPCSSALSFMSALVAGRKSTLMPMLNFIQGLVSKYPGETTPRQKDGALRMLGSLASVATKTKKVAPMMEAFFTAFVLPEFKSPHGFLRCRACEVVEKFESCDMDWENRENIETMFRALLGAVTDAELPVRIQAAIALPELVRYEDVRAEMVPNIGRIMQELLKMTNEVELDALTNTTRSLVAEFAEEVVPFAVELSEQLMSTYIRLVQEMLETRAKEAEAETLYDELGSEEKTLVCMNLLKTIDQLVTSLDKSPTSLARVEGLVLPGLELTIRHNLVELYDETFEILDGLVFNQKIISQSMWLIFEAMYSSLKTEAPDYFTDMANVFDNFISFGGATFAVDATYRKMLIDIYETVMTSRMLGAEDRCVAVKMAESMLLCLRGNIDEALPSIVAQSMNVLTGVSDDPDFTVTKPLLLHSLEAIVAGLYYNSALTLSLLSAQPTWTARFFQIWFKNLTALTRVHDRKLSIAAICSVFEDLAMRGDAAGGDLIGSADKLLLGALAVFREMPAALERRMVLEKEYKEGEPEEEDEDEELSITDDFEDEDDNEEDVFDRDNEYLEMISKAHDALEDDEDTDDGESSTWSEEILWVSPLDEFDSYQRFTSTLTSLEAMNPQLFQLATASLSTENKKELEAVAARASIGGEKAVMQTIQVVA